MSPPARHARSFPEGNGATLGVAAALVKRTDYVHPNKTLSLLQRKDAAASAMSGNSQSRRDL
jgi:hypothetical protein